MTRRAASDAPWLDALEARVGDAVERLAELGAENRRLAARVAELERRLAADEDGVVAERSAEDRDEWRERAEVERRVRRLVETLEELLSGDEDAGSGAG